MYILSQRDPQWSLQKIGQTKLSVGRWGCTITCVAMLSTYFNRFFSTPKKFPNQLAKSLKFTNQGLLIWKSLSEVVGFALKERMYGFNSKEIDKSLSADNEAVIFEVDHSHWVVALSRIPFTNIYRIADPWDGKKTFSTRYREITGSAHFIL